MPGSHRSVDHRHRPRVSCAVTPVRPHVRPGDDERVPRSDDLPARSKDFSSTRPQKVNRVVGGHHRSALAHCRRRRRAGSVVCEAGDDTSMGEPMLLAQLIGDGQLCLDPTVADVEEADSEEAHERGSNENGFDLLAEVGHRRHANPDGISQELHLSPAGVNDPVTFGRYKWIIEFLRGARRQQILLPGDSGRRQRRPEFVVVCRPSRARLARKLRRAFRTQQGGVEGRRDPVGTWAAGHLCG